MNNMRRSKEVVVCNSPPFDEGEFVKARIEGLPITMLVDTGATFTVLQESVFRRLPKALQANLGHDKKVMLTATGEPTPVLGFLRVKIEMNGYVVKRKVWFADIKNEGILGKDFLREEGCNIMLRDDVLW